MYCLHVKVDVRFVLTIEELFGHGLASQVLVTSFRCKFFLNDLVPETMIFSLYGIYHEDFYFIF